ncbi:MAG: hypothetical protein KJO85_09950, partial [Gammaproteobacteria bacterium]|nr:hypothetical protein [Gammaproteobacteria bacterium]
MSILSCLDQPPPPPEELLIGDGLFNIIGAMVFGSIALVALSAPLIRRAYRKHVVRLMGLDQVRPRPPGWWQRNAAHSSAAAPAARTVGSPAQLLEQASSWETRVTRATAAGWLTFVLMAWPLMALITPDPSLLDQLDAVAGAGLLALIPMFANLPQRWKKKVLMVSIVIGLVVVTGLEVAISVAESQQPGGAEEEASLLEDIAAAVLVLGLLYTIFHRRLRGLVFPVSVVITVFVLVIVLPLALVEQHLGSCLSGVQTSAADTGSDQIRSSGLAMI